MAVTANTSIDVTRLAFDPNRESLKDYLSRQTILQDYNFEGPTISILLDLLSLATYNMAFYDNMSINEGFITTAVLRDSVVSRGTALGYTPRSAIGARAVLNIIIVPGDDPDFITITQGTKFQTTIDGNTYFFETPQDYVIVADGDGIYQGQITIVQGISLTERIDVTGIAPHRFVLLNQNIDTSSLQVVVKPSSISSSQTIYTKVTDITEVMADSEVYYLEGDLNEKYALQFGDGVIGRALQAGEQVVVSYRVTEGVVCNSARSFTAVNNPGGYSVFALSLVTPAAGGADAETRDSIALAAPRKWERQKRLVIKEDYKSYIEENYPDFETVSVWGGEDNDPQMFGRVFISIKPSGAYTITQNYKDQLFRELDALNVQAIEPFFVDPTYIFVVPTVYTFYDSTKTNLTAQGIFSRVQTAMQTYEDSLIGAFELEFTESEFLFALKNAHASITNVEVSYKLQKRFVPLLNSIFTYTLQFNQEVFHPVASYQIPVVETSGFTIPGNAKKMYIDDDGNGTLRIYYLRNGVTRIYVNTNAGTINYTTGKVVLQNIAMSSVDNNELKFTITPKYKSFKPIQNQIILISDATNSVWRSSVARSQPAAYSASITTQGTDQITLDSVTGD